MKACTISTGSRRCGSSASCLRLARLPVSGAAGTQTAWQIHASVRSESSVCIQQSDSEGDSAVRKDRCASIVLVNFPWCKLWKCGMWNYLLHPTYPQLPQPTSQEKHLEFGKLGGFRGGNVTNNSTFHTSTVYTKENSEMES